MILLKQGRYSCQEKAHLRFYCPLMKKLYFKPLHENIRHRIVKSYEQKLFYWLLTVFQIRKLANVLICRGKLFPSGGKGSSTNACPVFRRDRVGAGPALFPPEVVVAVKALTCQLPKELGITKVVFGHEIRLLNKSRQNPGFVSRSLGRIAS